MFWNEKATLMLDVSFLNGEVSRHCIHTF